ncbi:MAG: hypothetical protein WDZ30_05090 [Cellvibrionaceae bacterium]
MNFGEARIVLEMPAGENAVVVTHMTSNSAARLLLDEVTLASPADFANADAHTRVTELTATQEADLIAYLLQLDRGSAPADDETIVLGSIDDSDEQDGGDGSDDDGDVDDGADDGTGDGDDGADDGTGGDDDDGTGGDSGDDSDGSGGGSTELGLFFLFLAWLRGLST